MNRTYCTIKLRETRPEQLEEYLKGRRFDFVGRIRIVFLPSCLSFWLKKYHSHKFTRLKISISTRDLHRKCYFNSCFSFCGIGTELSVLFYCLQIYKDVCIERLIWFLSSLQLHLRMEYPFNLHTGNTSNIFWTKCLISTLSRINVWPTPNYMYVYISQIHMMFTAESRIEPYNEGPVYIF